MRFALEVINDGRVIHAGMISHFPVYQHGAPGDPLYMRRIARLDGESPSVAELERELESGDLFFFLGYYRRPTQAYQVVRRAGARIVEVITGDGSDGPPQPDYVIRPKWPFGDAVTRVLGYDVEILPSSGIVQAAIYWAVVAAIWRELSRQDRAERVCTHPHSVRWKSLGKSRSASPLERSRPSSPQAAKS